MSLIEDAKKAGLSPDEIEALEAAEAEERAGQEALQAIANEGGEGDAAPAGDGEASAAEATPADVAESQPVGEGEPAAAAAGSEVQPATEPEPTPAAVERDRPFAPSLRTAEVVDQSERLKAITTEKAQALQKLVNGELEAADYAELDNRLTGEREAIVAQQTKAQLTAEHNEQMQQGLFEHEMKRFLKTSSKDGIDYSDKADRGRFERAFALVAGDQANAEKGMDQLDELFSEADRMVRAMKGVQPPAKPVAPSAPAQVAAAAPAAARQVPKTIGDLPAAAPAAAANSTREKAALLDGEDLERYLAGLPKAEHEKLLREAV